MTYKIVPRTAVGLPATVRSSSGQLRSPLRNERWIVAHYTGNNVDYTGRATAEVVRQIQAVFARSKPFEYNYVIGQADDNEIVEFAGKFQAAHSGGENSQSFGVLFLLGVGEPITDLMIDKWQWLRDVLIFDGSLRPNVEQRMHFQMPGAATACPGPVRARWPAMLQPWTQPTPTPPPTLKENDNMTSLTLWQHPAYREVFLIGGGPAINVTPRMFTHYRELGVELIVEAHQGMLAGCVAQSGIKKPTPVK